MEAIQRQLPLIALTHSNEERGKGQSVELTTLSLLQIILSVTRQFVQGKQDTALQIRHSLHCILYHSY